MKASIRVVRARPCSYTHRSWYDYDRATMIVMHRNSGMSMLRICLELMALHELSGFGRHADYLVPGI